MEHEPWPNGLHAGHGAFADLRFQKCVNRYDGDYRKHGFSCWDQFLCLSFAQLTYRESLRDIGACLRSVEGKLYHMGFRGRVSRSTLADANEGHDWRIYADFAQVLIATARPMYSEESLGFDLDSTVYALDSTTIDLCLSVFPWARFQSSKGAVKMHTLLDLRGSIPPFIEVSDGKVHNVNILDQIVPEAGSFYLMDRGYLDFERLHLFHRCGAFFVTRTKSGVLLRRRYSRVVDSATAPTFRSNRGVDLSRLFQTLSRSAPPCALSRRRTRPDPGLPDQQLRPACPHHRALVQIALEGGTVPQMDQAASANQSLLRQ